MRVQGRPTAQALLSAGLLGILASVALSPTGVAQGQAADRRLEGGAPGTLLAHRRADSGPCGQPLGQPLGPHAGEARGLPPGARAAPSRRSPRARSRGLPSGRRARHRGPFRGRRGGRDIGAGARGLGEAADRSHRVRAAGDHHPLLHPRRAARGPGNAGCHGGPDHHRGHQAPRARRRDGPHGARRRPRPVPRHRLGPTGRDRLQDRLHPCRDAPRRKRRGGRRDPR